MTPLDIDLYERIKNDYQTHGNLIVAVDYDNTLVPYNNPDMDCNVIVDLVKRCANLDFPIILFTCTPNGKRESTIKYLHCRDVLGIVSEKFKTNHCFLFQESPKPYWNVLLDDRAGLKESFGALNRLVTEIEGT